MVYIFPFCSSCETCNKHNCRSFSSYSRAKETNNEECKCQSFTVTADYFHVSIERLKREKCWKIIRVMRGSRGNISKSKLVQVESERVSSGVLNLSKKVITRLDGNDKRVKVWGKQRLVM